MDVIKSDELDPVEAVAIKAGHRDKIQKGDLFRRLIANWNDPELDKEEEKAKKKRERENKRKGITSAPESDEEERISKKVCTQSRATVQEFHGKYHANLQPPPEPPDVSANSGFKTALDEFIAKSFASWEWRSEENHQLLIQEWVAKMRDAKLSRKSKEWIRSVIQGLKDERRHYESKFTEEFMFLNEAMVRGMKYVKDNDSFVARLVYNDPDPEHPDIPIIKEEELKVDEAWVRTEFSKEDLQHIINMRQTKQWTQVPRDVRVMISKKKVVRVRYVPSYVRMIVDYEAVTAKVKAELVQKAAEAAERKRLGLPEPEPPKKEDSSLSDRRTRKARFGQTPTKTPRKPEPMVEEEQVEPPPRKPSTIRDKWIDKLENGKETVLEEYFVRMAFGEAFADELKLSIPDRSEHPDDSRHRAAGVGRGIDYCICSMKSLGCALPFRSHN